MIIVLDGPLGIGKSTLAEALMEHLVGCVMLDGDSLLAANPSPTDELQHLHELVVLLASYYQHFGYRHFVINHVRRSAAELTDLRRG